MRHSNEHSWQWVSDAGMIYYCHNFSVSKYSHKSWEKVRGRGMAIPKTTLEEAPQNFQIVIHNANSLKSVSERFLKKEGETCARRPSKYFDMQIIADICARAVLNEKKKPVPSPNVGKRRPVRVRAGKFLTGDS